MSHPRPTPSCQRIGSLLTEVAREIERVDLVPAGQVSAWLCQLTAVQSLLAARLGRDLQIADEARGEDTDRLLTVDQAAERLACTKDWLYRHYHRLTFALRNGRQLRFSSQGLDRYIRQRLAEETTSLPERAER